MCYKCIKRCLFTAVFKELNTQTNFNISLMLKLVCVFNSLKTAEQDNVLDLLKQFSIYIVISSIKAETRL